MIHFVCKYTPLELLAGFHEDGKLIDELADNYDLAGRLSHDNLCGFGKSMLQEVIKEKPKAIILVNCCDTMRRMFEVLREEKAAEFLFLLDLPHLQNCCAAQRLAIQFKNLISEYESYSGTAFDRAAFLEALCEPPKEPEPGPYIGILGVRCGHELESFIRESVPWSIRNLTCVRNRKVFLDKTEVSQLSMDELLRVYAEAVLSQFPCGRMGLPETRSKFFTDPNLRGIIYHTIKFCDYYELEYLHIKEAAAFPVVKLETDYTRQSEGQLRTRIDAFSETLKGLVVEKRASDKPKKTSKNKIYVAGIDSGSTSTDVVILNDKKEIQASVIIPTGGGASISAEEALESALQEAGLMESDISNIVKTGYGRDYIDVGNNSITEITCHAKGAHFLNPLARTIIDIGGQDSKAIRIDENGVVLNFAMNDKCAAGTGRFLEMMAQTLGLSLSEFSKSGLDWKEEIHISSMCTVFAESEVVSLVAQNKNVSDIVHGLNNSVASKVASLAKRVSPEEGFIMTGGVANNAGVMKALEEALGTKLFICDEAQLCGALGAALFALEQV